MSKGYVCAFCIFNEIVCCGSFSVFDRCYVFLRDDLFSGPLFSLLRTGWCDCISSFCKGYFIKQEIVGLEGGVYEEK